MRWCLQLRHQVPAASHDASQWLKSFFSPAYIQVPRICHRARRWGRWHDLLLGLLDLVDLGFQAFAAMLKSPGISHLWRARRLHENLPCLQHHRCEEAQQQAPPAGPSLARRNHPLRSQLTSWVRSSETRLDSLCQKSSPAHEIHHQTQWCSRRHGQCSNGSWFVSLLSPCKRWLHVSCQSLHCTQLCKELCRQEEWYFSRNNLYT